MSCKSRFPLTENPFPGALVVSSYRRLRDLASTFQLLRVIRVMGPTIIALSFAGVAHAQGTIDFSGAQTLLTSFKTFGLPDLLNQLDC
jgi:hypothetical protein